MMRTALVPAVLIVLVTVAPCSAQDEVPWGVSSSASSFRNYKEWFPKMTSIGVRTVRLFPEWGGLQPEPDRWTWDACDAMVKEAARNSIEINGILMGKPAWTKIGVHAFPMRNLPEWSAWVEATVAHYKDNVRYWEVWNEGNGGFNDEHHTTDDYARLAIAAYDAAKKGYEGARVGLTVASFDAPYLQHAIAAQAKAGRPDSFDTLCIHPYEIADGVDRPNGEIPYLWMTNRLRQALKNAGSAKLDAPVWITEVGRRLDSRPGQTVTEADAARALVKLYVMALAQGIRRTQWFEAQDPAGEDQGFGLLARDGRPRAATTAFLAMVKVLGHRPIYEGWVPLGSKARGYGFIFRNGTQQALVAWAPAGETATLSPSEPGFVVDLTDKKTLTPAGQTLTLADSPIFLIPAPGDLVRTAKANAGRPFPWGGDYSAAKTVTIDFTKPGDPIHGLFPTDAPTLKTFPDGTQGILVEGNRATNYFVHPSFAGLAASDYYVRVTVRRTTPGNVGMNCVYELADSQGRSPYKNVGDWFGLAPGEGWQSHTWHLTGASFSALWGFDVGLRPEQSVTFAIGKVEVSTEPLQ
jgi:hypothetical protein